MKTKHRSLTSTTRKDRQFLRTKAASRMHRTCVKAAHKAERAKVKRELRRRTS